MVGLNPEVGHEQMAGLNFVHGIAQALWHGKLFHIDLNGQHGAKYDQDLVFGHGDLQERVLPGRPAGERRLRRPAPLRLQADAHRGHLGRVGLGRREHAHVPDPQGAGAGVPRRPGGRGGARGLARRRARRADARPPARRTPRSPPTTFDLEAAGARGYHFERLDQLAVEHLLGARVREQASGRGGRLLDPVVQGGGRRRRDRCGRRVPGRRRTRTAPRPTPPPGGTR